MKQPKQAFQLLEEVGIKKLARAVAESKIQPEADVVKWSLRVPVELSASLGSLSDDTKLLVTVMGRNGKKGGRTLRLLRVAVQSPPSNPAQVSAAPTVTAPAGASGNAPNLQIRRPALLRRPVQKRLTT